MEGIKGMQEVRIGILIDMGIALLGVSYALYRLVLTNSLIWIVGITVLLLLCIGLLIIFIKTRAKSPQDKQGKALKGFKVSNY